MRIKTMLIILFVMGAGCSKDIGEPDPPVIEPEAAFLSHTAGALWFPDDLPLNYPPNDHHDFENERFFKCLDSCSSTVQSVKVSFEDDGSIVVSYSGFRTDFSATSVAFPNVDTLVFDGVTGSPSAAPTLTFTRVPRRLCFADSGEPILVDGCCCDAADL